MHWAALLVAFISAWSFRAGASIVAAPVASGPNVIVADTQGDVFALDRSSGKVHWSTQLENGVWSAPILFGDRVIVSSGDREFVAVDPPVYAIAGARPSDIAGLDARTGSVLWEYDLAGTGAPGAALAGGALIHHDGSSEVLALNPQDGHYRWRTFVASTAAWNTGVAIANDRFATSGMFPNAVLILRARDGAIVHRVTFPPGAVGFAQAKIAVDGTRVYGTYFLLGRIAVERLYAVDANRGAMLWDVAVDRGITAAPLPQLTVRHGVVYAGSPFRGVLQAYNGTTGARLWETSLHGTSVGGAAVENDRLFVADGAGWITALDDATGAVYGTFDAGQDMQDSTPAIVNGALVVGSQSGVVHSIPLTEITR